MVFTVLWNGLFLWRVGCRPEQASPLLVNCVVLAFTLCMSWMLVFVRPLLKTSLGSYFFVVFFFCFVLFFTLKPLSVLENKPVLHPDSLNTNISSHLFFIFSDLYIFFHLAFSLHCLCTLLTYSFILSATFILFYPKNTDKCLIL